MNLLKAAILPVNFCTSFTFIGEGMEWIALIWSGLASMPRWVTIYPRNFPELTPNEHLAGLSFMLYLQRVEKPVVGARYGLPPLEISLAYHRCRPPWFLLFGLRTSYLPPFDLRDVMKEVFSWSSGYISIWL
ncbi:hypothetical protein YC2023_061394 [Brassica napus]